MKSIFTLLTIFYSLTFLSQQKVEDDFEGNGTISSWVADGTSINTDFLNPSKQGINTSNKVLEYKDDGAQYANVYFDINKKFDLSVNYTFSLKIYIPSSGLTGIQNNQVSLKLQDNANPNGLAPWQTQAEIIKSVVLDQWQTVTFNYKDDTVNFQTITSNPTERTDFNRVLIQINGEDNTDKVTAYLDDFSYDGTIEGDAPVDTNFDTLVWSDEFNDDGDIDNSKWFHQTFGPNGGRWFNGELQHYTDSNTNSFVSNGNLNIVAKKETKTQNGVSLNYTSARLNSKFAFTYGRVDVRASLPKDNGTWPAIWTLGKNITETGAYWQTQGFGTTPWPACGEIDIMEHGLHGINTVSSALHTPSSNGNTVNTATKPLADVNTFHVYSMIWTPESIAFLVDDVEYYTYAPQDKNANTWPFNKDQFLLLNLAIGGFSGNVDANYTESAMVIDYVRVYQSSNSLSVDENELETDFVRIYPNPAKEKLTINYKENLQNREAFLYSITGKKVYTFSQSNQSKTFDISFLNKGVYFLKVASKSGIKTLKIIKN